MVRIVKEILPSPLMQKELPFWVILPENYDDSAEQYPVLYLLHGLLGSCENWLELTDLKNYLAHKKMIVVLPEGENSWYSDSATIENNKFESSFITELIPAVEKKFRVLKTKEKRAVAGLSMGGYGALKFALKRIDLFSFAGSMSGAFDAPNLSETNPGFDWENLGPSILEVFGNKQSAARKENDLFRLISRISAKEKNSLPEIYIDCGLEDGF